MRARLFVSALVCAVLTWGAAAVNDGIPTTPLPAVAWASAAGSVDSLGGDQGILPVGLSADSATSVTVARLAAADSNLNGSLVSFRGEAVGEAVKSASPRYKWVMLQAGSSTVSSVEVLMANDQVALIENYGSYKTKGSTLLVTGIYRVADPDQGGELDVVAYTVSVVDPGGPVEEELDWRKLPLGIALVVLGLGLTALKAHLKWRSRS